MSCLTWALNHRSQDNWQLLNTSPGMCGYPTLVLVTPNITADLGCSWINEKDHHYFHSLPTHISGWGLEGEPVADTTAAGQWLHKTSLVLRLKWNEMKRNQDKGGWEQRLRAGRSFLSSGQSKHLGLFLLNTKLKTLLLSCNYLLVRPHKEKLDL